jgi:hypothetical protein
MYWRPGDNLVGFLETPNKTIVLFASFGIVAWFALRNWMAKPASLQTAFLVMLPIQMLLHFLAGNPYEIRVYAESLPFVFLLATWKPRQAQLREGELTGPFNDFSRMA